MPEQLECVQISGGSSAFPEAALVFELACPVL
jgi:hypothetical protein